MTEVLAASPAGTPIAADAGLEETLQWTPLPMLAHGKIIQSFTPIDKFPSLKLSAFFQNLYFGDEVFLFETNNANWARGYLIVHPLPSDFISRQADLDKLPEMKVSVVIVPLSHVYITSRIPMNSNFSAPVQSDFDNGVEHASIPSVYELQQSNSKARNGELVDDSTNVKLKPPLPIVRLNSGELTDETLPSLSQLGSHIFSFYAISEYSLFEKLYELFEELNDIRIKLQKNLLTKNETIEAKLQTSFLLTKISKLLSSKGVNRFTSQSGKSSQLKTDPSGFQTLTARDISTGELYDCTTEDLAKQPIPKLIAANQICSALTPNFPVTNDLEQQLHPSKITKFDIVTPSQILVDFKDVDGSSMMNPNGFVGMTAYLFLRTAKKRLTEAFAIHIKSSKDFSLDKISAALFRNIPGTEIDSGRIYLVAIITEEIKVKSNPSDTQISIVRKGLAAGVTDISRIFSRHKGHLKSGQSHQFIIKLFGSYVNKGDNTKLDQSNMNFGWGELIDRIIAGSNQGVAVNPRAEKLIVSVKEFKDDLVNVANEFDVNLKTPIFQIRTNFFDPLVKAFDRIYVELGKVNITNNSSRFPGDLISIQLVNENPNSEIKISKGNNVASGDRWDFTSVRSNEVIGEIIKLSNIENIGDNEKLSLKLYVNYELRSVSEFIVSSKGLIYEYHKSQMIKFENPRTKQNEGSVEVRSVYIGKTFNIEESFHQIMNWKNFFPLPDHKDQLLDTLKRLNQATLPQLIKFFQKLLNSLLDILNTAIKMDLHDLKTAAFYSYIHLLDIVIARQEQYTYLFYDYVKEVTEYLKEEDNTQPLLGSDLLFIAATYFDKAETEWRYVGRTLCRILPLLVKISVLIANKDDYKEFKSAWNALFQTLTAFLKLRVESIIPDQVLVLDYTDLFLEHLRGVYEDSKVVDFSIDLIASIGQRGTSTGSLDSMVSAISLNNNSNAKLHNKEAKICISKLLLIRRFLNGFIFSNDKIPDETTKFFFHSLNWAIETYNGTDVDLEVLRLANSVLISCCNLCWTIITEKKDSLQALPRNISRLLLAVAKIFVGMHQYARNNGLFEPKRNYTTIFPNTYPFNELIADSTVNDVVFVEILVEISVIYSFLTKIAKNIITSSSSQGFISIIEKSKNDSIFNSSPLFVSTFEKEDLFYIIQTNRLIIQSSFFPSTKWISLYALLIESATTSSELIKFVLIRNYIPVASETEKFDRSLWSRYLKVILSIATSMPASICHLAEVPRKASWKITGDVRTRCANLINQSWDCLGWDSLKRDFVRFQTKRNSGYHAEFIQEDYSILEELSVFCLQRHSLCQIVGVKVLWSIMIAELLVQENVEEPLPNKLIEVERGVLLGLDKFFKADRYVPRLYEQRNFIKRLKMVVRLDPEDESFNDVYDFITNLSEFLDVQNDLSSVPYGEEFDDERTFHQLDILKQLMRVNNAKKFNASLHGLFEGNLNKNNHVQAALCLELMASNIKWSVNEVLPVSFKPTFPSETAFERKERLYKEIAEELIKGNKLEKAVTIYKELAEAYDRVNFNLNGLSFVHEKLSQLYLKLTSLDRETPTYFKVTFIGLAFPKTVRSRSFIFEGLPFEHISSIHNRFLRLYTGATIINDEEASAAMRSPPPGKFLNIAIVRPQTDFNNYHGDLSRAARLYMQNRDLRYFTTSRRLQKSTSVLNLWVEETTYETYSVFPTLMNRSEILKTRVVKLSPIQNALRTLSAKTQDLVNAESSAQKLLDSSQNYSSSSVFNELARNLSGTVNSPVNGGIGQYKEFFQVKLEPEDEEDKNGIDLLQNAFDNLTICIFRCLLIHGRMVPSSLRDSHSAMINLFEKNFAEEIKRTGLSIEELETAFVQNSGESTPTTLSKVPSLNTINTSNNNSIMASQQQSSGIRTPSMVSLNGNSGLSRTESRASQDSSSRASHVTQTSTETGSKRRFLKNWRQSRV